MRAISPSLINFGVRKEAGARNRGTWTYEWCDTWLLLHATEFHFRNSSAVPAVGCLNRNSAVLLLLCAGHEALFRPPQFFFLPMPAPGMAAPRGFRAVRMMRVLGLQAFNFLLGLTLAMTLVAQVGRAEGVCRR
jgi:hypothetical protein